MVAKQKEAKKIVDKVVQKTSALQVDDVDEYQSMIAEAAYYKAEKKGFRPGQEMEHWLEAEKDIVSSTDKA